MVCVAQLFAGLLALASAASFAADAPTGTTLERGLPFINWYGPRDYAAGTQNWSVVQDPQGLVHVGNDSVVLSFDGARWSRTEIVPGRAVRSLALAGDGRVLVGSQASFGYLARDLAGQLSYVELSAGLPESAPDFQDVWQTLVIGTDWYFSSPQALFRMRDNRIDIFEHGEHIAGGAFAVNGRLYVDRSGMGLSRLDDDRLVDLGMEHRGRAIYALLPLADGRILVATRDTGLLVMDEEGGAPEPLAPAISAFLTANHVYHGITLPDGRIALATLRGGLVLADPLLDRFEVLDRDRGLPDVTIRHLHLDREQGLWMAMDSGVARIEWQAALSRWDSGLGLEGPALSLLRHQGQLHAGTTLGLFRLEAGRFQRIDGVTPEVWQLLTWTPPGAGPQLLAATSYGIYGIEDGRVRRVSEPYLSIGLALDPDRPERLWVASYDRGLGYLEWPAEGEAVTVWTGPELAARRLESAPDGTLWLETWLEGLLRIDPRSGETLWRFPPAGSDHDPTGLTVLGTLDPPLIGDRSGLYGIDADGNLTEREDLRASLLMPTGGTTLLIAGDQGEIWSLASAGHSGQVRVGLIDPFPRVHSFDALLRRLPDIEFYTVYSEADGQTWVSGSEALYQIAAQVDPKPETRFEVIWRSVSAGKRRLLLDTDEAETLAPGDFPLRFEFAAAAMDWPEGTRYRHRLLPVEEDWSAWQALAEREFSLLLPGQYQLLVQARSSEGRLSESRVFSFQVPAPWYRQPLFMVMIGGLLLALVPLLLWLGGRHQARRSAQLETLVAERTRELEQQQRLLQRERDKLDYLSEHDELTGLPNRRQAQRRLRELGPEGGSAADTLALALVDIDHFKRINDRYGHDVGDRVLTRVAGLLRRHARPGDLVARWGGEEFFLLFPVTSARHAAAVCRRASDAIAAEDWDDLAEGLRVSISAGVAESDQKAGFESLLKHADELLYAAKRGGRNKVRSQSDNADSSRET